MSSWDDEAGYDRGDPKHPDWAGIALARADALRKEERERGVLSRSKPAAAAPDPEPAPGGEGREERP